MYAILIFPLTRSGSVSAARAVAPIVTHHGTSALALMGSIPWPSKTKRH